jgi:hypothetical protein
MEFSRIAGGDVFIIIIADRSLCKGNGVPALKIQEKTSAGR